MLNVKRNPTAAHLIKKKTTKHTDLRSLPSMRSGHTTVHLNECTALYTQILLYPKLTLCFTLLEYEPA